MRSYHRWFGALAALFLAFIALTGIALQLDLWLTGHAPPGSDEPPPLARPLALPADGTLQRMIATAADAVRTRHPRISAERIELRFGAHPLATIGSAAPFGPHVAIDPVTGADIAEPRMVQGYHAILQDLHAGYRFGVIGRIVSMLAGVALLVLSITGLLVYLDLFRRRRRAGRHAFFWR